MTDIDSFTNRIVQLRKEKGFKTDWSNFAEKVMLIITELGRAVDADRKGNKKLVSHELTDALVRHLDLMGSLKISPEVNLLENLHNWERRIHKHGKRY